VSDTNADPVSEGSVFEHVRSKKTRPKFSNIIYGDFFQKWSIFGSLISISTNKVGIRKTRPKFTSMVISVRNLPFLGHCQ
jgi:hypothetical protein